MTDPQATQAPGVPQIDMSTFQPNSVTQAGPAPTAPQVPVPGSSGVTVDMSTFKGNGATNVTQAPDVKPEPSLLDRMDQYGQNGVGVTPALERVMSGLVRTPGHIYSAFMDDPSTDEEQQIHDNGIATPQGHVPGSVALPVWRLFGKPMEDAQDRADAYAKMAETEANPKLKKQLIDAAQTYSFAAKVPMVPMAASMAERGAYGPQGASKLDSKGQGGWQNENEDLLGMTTEGAAYALAPKAQEAVTDAATGLVKRGLQALPGAAGRAAGRAAMGAGKVAYLGAKASIPMAANGSLADDVTSAASDSFDTLRNSATAKGSDVMDAMKNIRDKAGDALAKQGITGEAASSAIHDLMNRVQDEYTYWTDRPPSVSGGAPEDDLKATSKIMITKADEAELLQKGYTQDQINKLTPDKAADILGGEQQSTPPSSGEQEVIPPSKGSGSFRKDDSLMGPVKTDQIGPSRIATDADKVGAINHPVGFDAIFDKYNVDKSLLGDIWHRFKQRANPFNTMINGTKIPYPMGASFDGAMMGRAIGNAARATSDVATGAILGAKSGIAKAMTGPYFDSIWQLVDSRVSEEWLKGQDAEGHLNFEARMDGIANGLKSIGLKDVATSLKETTERLIKEGPARPIAGAAFGAATGAATAAGGPVVGAAVGMGLSLGKWLAKDTYNVLTERGIDSGLAKDLSTELGTRVTNRFNAAANATSGAVSGATEGVKNVASTVSDWASSVADDVKERMSSQAGMTPVSRAAQYYPEIADNATSAQLHGGGLDFVSNVARESGTMGSMFRDKFDAPSLETAKTVAGKLVDDITGQHLTVEESAAQIQKALEDNGLGFDSAKTPGQKLGTQPLARSFIGQLIDKDPESFAEYMRNATDKQYENVAKNLDDTQKATLRQSLLGRIVDASTKRRLGTIDFSALADEVADSAKKLGPDYPKVTTVADGLAQIQEDAAKTKIGMSPLWKATIGIGVVENLWALATGQSLVGLAAQVGGELILGYGARGLVKYAMTPEGLENLKFVSRIIKATAPSKATPEQVKQVKKTFSDLKDSVIEVAADDVKRNHVINKVKDVAKGVAQKFSPKDDTPPAESK